jgi:hypothetical protein
MSFRSFYSKRRQTIVAIALCAMPAVMLRASDLVATNASAATNDVVTPVEKTFLQSLGSHFFKPNPASVKSPFNSMTALPAPAPLPQQPQLPRNRSESLDPQKDWRFAPSDQIAERFIAQEVLKLKNYDVDDNATGSAAELARFYQRVLRGNMPTNHARAYDPSGRRIDGEGEEANGYGTKPGGSVKDLLTPGADALHAGSLGDLLGFSKSETPEELRARKEQRLQIEEFKRMLGMPAQPYPPVASVLESPPGPLSEPARSFSPRPAYSTPASHAVMGASTPLNSFAPSAVQGGLSSQSSLASPVSPSLAPVLAPSTATRSTPAPLNVTPGRRNF